MSSASVAGKIELGDRHEDVDLALMIGEPRIERVEQWSLGPLPA